MVFPRPNGTSPFGLDNLHDALDSFDVTHFGVLRLGGAFLFRTAGRKRSAGQACQFLAAHFQLAFESPVKTRESVDKPPHSKKIAQRQNWRVVLIVVLHFAKWGRPMLVIPRFKPYDFTLIFFGLLFSHLGNLTSSTPLVYSAATSSSLMSQGRVSVLEKHPLRRSTR
jgi:hypothetical protein